MSARLLHFSARHESNNSAAKMYHVRCVITTAVQKLVMSIKCLGHYDSMMQTIVPTAVTLPIDSAEARAAAI